jgi:hypothetical protein
VCTNNITSCSRIYVDNRLHRMMVLNINEPFWERGDFPQVVSNGSDYIALKNPWANGSPAAPFDRRTFSFLAILDELRLIRCWGSLLFDPQRRRWWNERVVPGRFRRETVVRWFAQ